MKRWLVCVLSITYLFSCGKGSTSNSQKNVKEPATCVELAESFGDAVYNREYSTAYRFTTNEYQGKVSLSDFIETHRSLREKHGDPKKWGISEVGYFETDTGHGVGIDFGEKEINEGEIDPKYHCV